MNPTQYRFARRAEILGKSIHDHDPDAIVLNSGLAHPPLLPDVGREAAIAARNASESMQYGPLMGIDDLRDQIVRYVEVDGVACGRENILVTNGAKHALDLACRAFVEPGDRIIVSRPTYMTALINMRLHGASFLAVPQDDEGMDAAYLERELERLAANGEQMPKLLFDVPDFHNPTGITMSMPRRIRLVEMAEAYGFVICEDDPYRRIRFEGADVPPMKSFDRAGVVIALGTVSKILSPGLRTGWAIATPEIVQRMAAQKSEGGSSPFGQRVVAELMRSNRMGEHISAIRNGMQAHRDIMLDSIAESLPSARVKRPQGGYFLWCELAPGVSAETVARKAREFGVEVGTGRLSFPGSDPDSFLRFAYSYPSANEIRDGIRRLGKALQSVETAA